jgi:ATP-dependent Clp protease adaptor protein ClpS
MPVETMTATIHPPMAAGASCLAGRFVLLPDDPADGGPPDDGSSGGGTNTGVITKTKPKTKKPSLYKVLLLNDDYTPMEFVIHVLERFFNKGREDATRIMLHVHQNGVGVCGVFTYEVAETKVTQVMDFAGQHQHPLQCTMEKE